MNNNEIDIQEINKNLQENYIHYNLNRVDYTINNMELELIEKSGNSIWKDFFIATLALAIPSLINAFNIYKKNATEENLSIELFVNSLVGGISIVLAIICGIVWQNNVNTQKTIIKQIKNKPKFKIPTTSK